MTTDHRDNVTPIRRPDAERVWHEADVDALGSQLLTLVDLGRAIAARASLMLVADPELVLAGQRVEHIAGRIFERIFDAPVGAPQ